MNHTLKKTYGIDDVIQSIQTELFDYLSDLWDIKKLDAYGRVYKLSKDNNVLPKVYDTLEKDYKEVYYNERSCFFFVDSENQSGDGHSFESDLDIIFMLNLNDIYKSSKERVDERVFTDVVRFIRESYEGVFTITNHIKELDAVLRDFDITKIKDNDIQPLHVFGIRGLLEYFINDNSC